MICGVVTDTEEMFIRNQFQINLDGNSSNIPRRNVCYPKILLETFSCNLISSVYSSFCLTLPHTLPRRFHQVLIRRDVSGNVIQNLHPTKGTAILSPRLFYHSSLWHHADTLEKNKSNIETPNCCKNENLQQDESQTET